VYDFRGIEFLPRPPLPQFHQHLALLFFFDLPLRHIVGNVVLKARVAIVQRAGLVENADAVTIFLANFAGEAA
jgi:hypothetical protein